MPRAAAGPAPAWPSRGSSCGSCRPGRRAGLASAVAAEAEGPQPRLASPRRRARPRRSRSERASPLRRTEWPDPRLRDGPATAPGDVLGPQSFAGDIRRVRTSKTKTAGGIRRLVSPEIEVLDNDAHLLPTGSRSVECERFHEVRSTENPSPSATPPANVRGRWHPLEWLRL